jgi:UDP-N-acetylmuramyl pentapeptide synthase
MSKTKNNIMEAKAEIAQATKDAGVLLAKQAEDAMKVIATAAAEALKVTNLQTSGDHDLIIKLDTKMDALKTDIQDLKDGTTNKLASHELRLNALETSNTRLSVMLVIGSGILTFLVGLLIFHLFKSG